ncbi:MAG: UDP-2,3-diacylglucosamine diphosphatase [Bacteroidales bacterium]|nr:UDP-2,3-diacylglucosamine diphosphatase [Bacteroidales bacterium]
MSEKNKIYFLSDAHLGIPDFESSLEREKLLVKWLEEVSLDAKEIYLLGDIFDFWFEYKKLAPRGFTRFLGTLAKLTDSGVKIYFFTGNHDMWVFDYLPKETGVIICREPEIKEFSGKRFYIAHGDGLGPFDKKFKLLKRVFKSKTCQWFFKRLHPNFSFWIAQSWSRNSRKKHKLPEHPNFEEEWLVKYARMVLEEQHIDHFVFGHRHIPYQYQLNEKSSITNLGDWLINFSYAVFDGEELKQFKGYV